MYKNITRTIEDYVVAIVGITLLLDFFLFIICVVGLFIDGSTIFPLLISIFIAIATYVTGAFLLGFAELIENSKKQTKILEDIRNHFIDSSGSTNREEKI